MELRWVRVLLDSSFRPVFRHHTLYFAPPMFRAQCQCQCESQCPLHIRCAGSPFTETWASMDRKCKVPTPTSAQRTRTVSSAWMNVAGGASKWKAWTTSCTDTISVVKHLTWHRSHPTLNRLLRTTRIQSNVMSAAPGMKSIQVGTLVKVELMCQQFVCM